MSGNVVIGGVFLPCRGVTITRVILILTFSILPISIAVAKPAGCLPRTPAAGINTSRLKDSDLAKWCSIEQLVLAVNQAGQPKYPLLRYLFKWAEFSDHLIYIELPETRPIRFNAGSFHIERFDRCGLKQEAVIRLYLETIDRVYVGASTRRSDGLIPFSGLNREERYAEVLGHELGHAFDILNDFRLTRKFEELVQQTNRRFIAFKREFQSHPLDPQLQELLTGRDALLEHLENAAMEFEKVIWQELRGSHKGGPRSSPTAR
jgi:hypothetical protein